MNEKLKYYLQGLGLSAVGVIVIAACEGLKVDATFPMAHILVPAAIAAVGWTLMFLASTVLWWACIGLTYATGGIGIFLVPLLVGILAGKMSAYLLPTGWFTFSKEDGGIYCFGLVLALIDGVHHGIHYFLDDDGDSESPATESPKRRSKKKKEAVQEKVEVATMQPSAPSCSSSSSSSPPASESGQSSASAPKRRCTLEAKDDAPTS